MASLAQAFMDHSGKDEFGNLVLLFEDKKIKMAIVDGRVLLSCNDIRRTCGHKLVTGRLTSKDLCVLVTHQDLGQKITSYHVDPETATGFLASSRVPGTKPLLEFLKSEFGVEVEPKPKMKRPRPAMRPEKELPSQPGIEFRKIPGASSYCAGNDGSVWSSRTGEWIRINAGLNKDGYYSVNIKTDANRTGEWPYKYRVPVHRLVLLAFKGNPLPRQMACHNNGDKLDNRPENLRWGSAKDNSEDTVRHGRQVRGEASPQAVLDNNTVIAIRELRKRNVPAQQIADLLWLPEGAVKGVAYGKTWKHVV